MKYLLLIILTSFFLLQFSCSDKVDSKLVKQNGINLSISITSDSTLCVDTLVYLVLATKQDTNDKFEKLLLNELQVDTLTGNKFYLLKLTTENNDTVSIVSDYWDLDNGVYNLADGGGDATFIYTCDGGGCTVVHNLLTDEVYCEYNGNRQDGKTECTFNCVEKKFKSPLVLDEGKSIYNNLLFVSPFIVTF